VSHALNKPATKEATKQQMKIYKCAFIFLKSNKSEKNKV